MLRGSDRKTTGRVCSADTGLGRDDTEGFNSARLAIDRTTHVRLHGI